MKKVEQSIKQFISQTIRTVPDFPKEGIQFKDITTLLQDKKALKLTSFMLERPFIEEHIDIVIGLESRGFLFGTNLAQDLNAAFVPVRKPGKLPHETISESYELEYGVDQMEIHKDAIFEGAKVLIHDDLIATGGTASAASKLVERLGGKVIGYSFIIEISALKGRDLLLPGVPVESILVE